MENLFGIQAHPEVNVQDFKKVRIPGMLAKGKIDKKGQRFCEETLNLPLDPARVVAPKRILTNRKNIVK